MDLGSRELVIALGFLLAGYLCGAIPFGLLIGRLKGIDIRTCGSGNIGATNAGRVLGKPFGYLVFGLDLLKGLLPTMFAGFFLQRLGASQSSAGSIVYLLWVAVATSCILGHMFPIYLKFKGGKGVATALGALLGIYPYFTLPALIALFLWVVVTLTTRYVSVGSMAAAGGFPIVFAIMVYAQSDTWVGGRQLWPLYLFTIVVAGLVIYRHRSNIQRLMDGVEPKIGSSDQGS